MINWDLSDSHTLADVTWPRPDLELTEIRPIRSVAIRFPGGRVFKAGDELHDISMEREGPTVTYIQIDSHPRSTEETYRLASAWASDWGLPQEPLDRWHQARIAGRKRGNENIRSTTLTTEAGRRIAPGGPVPSVQIRYSFNQERPSLVSLQFYWGRMPRLGGG